MVRRAILLAVRMPLTPLMIEMRTMKTFLALNCLWIAAPGCGGGSDGDDGCGGGDIETVREYFALARGASWTYDNVDYRATPELETTLEKTIRSDCETVTFDDCVSGEAREHSCYVQETMGGAADAEDANLLYMELNGDGLVRVQQDHLTGAKKTQRETYSPYFMRLVAGPYSQGDLCEFTHERCEYVGDAAPIRSTKRYRHEVVSTDESVTVPSDTYTGVLHIKRTDLGDGKTKDFWYARGVGKIKEEGKLATGMLVSSEALVAFEAGSGGCE